MNELPKQLYVRVCRYDGEADVYYNAEHALEDHASTKETRKVGVYKLERVITVEAEVKVID